MPTSTPGSILTDIPSALPNEGMDFGALFNNAIQLITVVIAIAAFVAIVYSGLMMITSDGDAAKMATARKNLLWAIIGLVVASLSYFLVVAVYREASRATSPGGGATPTAGPTGDPTRTMQSPTP